MDQAQPLSETVDLHLRLETTVKEFLPRRADLLAGLALAADLKPERLSIVDVRTGCVIVVLRLAREDADAIKAAFHSRPLDDKGDVFARFSVEAVRDEIEIGRKQVSVHRGGKPDLSWLHLSDIHIKAPVDGPETDLWMKDFLRDLRRELDRCELDPRFVLVSGDVAFGGSEGEYAKALDFLDRVRKELPTPDCPVIVAPGNHDIEWREIEADPEKVLRLRISGEGPEPVVSALAAPPDDGAVVERDRVMRRHQSFRDFTRKLAERIDEPATDGVLVSSARWVFDDLEVGVAALNSALLSCRDDLLVELGVDEATARSMPPPDPQFLALGDVQLREAYDALQGCDLKIAVVHHPPYSTWYHELDHVNHRTWLPEFDFIHRGHTHVASMENRTPLGLELGTFEIAAGALHTTPDWYRGFVGVGVDRAQGMMRACYWTYGGRANRWHLDTLAAGNGVEERPLPADLAHRVRRT